MSYSQLTPQERQRIYLLQSEDCLSARVIARLLNRDPSTISRELRRNCCEGLYLPDTAQRLMQARRQAAKVPFLKVSCELLRCIKSALQHFHSPEQIAGRLKLEGREFLSHETIYKLIYSDYKELGACRQYLRQGQKLRRRRGGSKSKRGGIPNRVDIEFRPQEADQKAVVGHWEGDTVIGANHQGGLVTYVDKASKFLVTGLIKNKTAIQVTAVSIKLLRTEANSEVKTLTFDNGKEFSRHEAIGAALGATCYFAKPYHSWERGLNEHTNGLLRQFFPKSTNFWTVKPEQVQRAMDLINDRPRKSLDYRTPREVFLEQSGAVALQI